MKKYRRQPNRMDPAVVRQAAHVDRGRTLPTVCCPLFESLRPSVSLSEACLGNVYVWYYQNRITFILVSF